MKDVLQALMDVQPCGCNFVCSGSPGRESMVSCTSKPCQWNIPRKRKVENVVISRCKFKKHEHGKAKIEKYTTPDEPTPSVTAPAKHKLIKNTRFCNYLHAHGEANRVENWQKNWSKFFFATEN